MKNLFTFLCIMALLTGSLAGCNKDKAPGPSSPPVTTGVPTTEPMIMPDPEDGVVEDDDGIIAPEESAAP